MGSKPRKRSAVAALVLVAAACGHHGDDFDGGPPTPTGATCPDGGTALTYDEFGRPFFDDYCQRCHASTVTGGARMGAPSTRTYDTIDDIRMQTADIDERSAAGPAVINGDMPRGEPRPTDEERFELGEWLACGAP